MGVRISESTGERNGLIRGDGPSQYALAPGVGRAATPANTAHSWDPIRRSRLPSCLAPLLRPHCFRQPFQPIPDSLGIRERFHQQRLFPLVFQTGLRFLQRRDQRVCRVKCVDDSFSSVVVSNHHRSTPCWPAVRHGVVNSIATWAGDTSGVAWPDWLRSPARRIPIRRAAHCKREGPSCHHRIAETMKTFSRSSRQSLARPWMAHSCQRLHPDAFSRASAWLSGNNARRVLHGQTPGPIDHASNRSNGAQH